MSDSKTPPNDGESFFRKVVRFVANPTTDWADLTKGELETRESEYAKSELKAMIERKRRNDFVRKREFDMLRKIRREGITSEGLSGLAGLSNLDDSEARQPDNARTDGVKAKIDEIEQQMVGESASYSGRRTAPAPLAGAPAAAPAMTESFFNAPTMPLSLQAGSEADPRGHAPAPTPTSRKSAAANAPAPARSGAPAPAPARAAAAPAPAMAIGNALANLSNPFAVEVNELAHDPELDEAVIAFANADFEQCERTVRSLISPGGARQQHAETWLVLFDLYRAIGQQQSFESLALDYVHQFGWSPPQWFSLPKLVADAAVASDERKTSSGSAKVDSAVSWVSPEAIDADSVARLRSQLLQMPMPWVLDWSALRSIDAEACHELRELFQSWAKQQVDMRWLAGEQLFSMLAEAAPSGVRDVDPEYWLLRLEACRLANRPDQFDEVAIDYCMTYEVSPPSWEPARSSVRMGSSTGATAAQLSHVSEVSTGFVESEIDEDGQLQMAAVDLSGQLVGDISGLLKGLEAKLGTASIVNVSCAKLIRVDFIAAGDLLNWVLARRSENRAVNFDDTNRLVALFCGAMGINEHARVKVRNI